MKRSIILFSLCMMLVMLTVTGQGCVLNSKSSNSATSLGVFRSPDKGEAWKDSNSLPASKSDLKNLNGIKVYRLFNDPSDPDALYLTTRGQGMFYSYDKGESWQEVSFFAKKFLYTVAVDPKNKCILYANDEGSVYKSTDCSRTWTVVYTEVRQSMEVQSVAVDYGNSQLLYIAVGGVAKENGDILVSSDAGKSWQAVKTLDMRVRLLVADPFTPRRIYVAGVDSLAGLWRSDDAGATWKELTPGFIEKYPGSAEFLRFVFHPNKKDNLFWISKYGILRSNDAGTTWADYKLQSAPGDLDIYAFAISPATDNDIYFTGTSMTNGDPKTALTRFYKSTNGGKSWSVIKLPTNALPAGLYIHPKDPNLLLLGFTSLGK